MFTEGLSIHTVSASAFCLARQKLEGRGAFDGLQVRGLMSDADVTHLTRRMARTAPLAVKFVDALPPFAMLAMTAARVLDVSTARAVPDPARDSGRCDNVPTTPVPSV